VKSSIALLFLLPLGLIFLYFTPEKRREGLFLLLPAIIFFLFALSSNFNTGIRHILPIYGLLIILASAGAVWLCRKFYAFRFALAALLLLNAAASVRTAPNYLVYANDLWGGYKSTHEIFVDSNADTGQSMKLVDEYLAREGIQDCWIAAFVHPEMIRSVQPCRSMPSGTRIMVSRDLIEPVPPVIEGTVVLSVIEMPPRGGDEYVPVTQSEPIAFIGGNTYIYRGRFEVPLAAAISRVHRSNHFLRVNDIDQAIVEGRQAAELAPKDPRTHLALGLALSRTEQKDEARRELETAVELAKADSRFRNAEVWAQQGLEKLR
jgi:tetratricopeptide (TPR) repeat protein